MEDFVRPALVCPLPNENDYDAQAVRDGDWKHIFLIIDSTGPSGSVHLLSWLLEGEFIQPNMWTASFIFHDRKLKGMPSPKTYGKIASVIRHTGSHIYECILLERGYIGNSTNDIQSIDQEQETCAIM